MTDVTIANFEQEVITASLTVPVLLDFWAPWCGPCKSLTPVLEKVALAYAGRFKLVKVDSDQEQELSAAFGIRSIPTCILMIGGQPVDAFSGALPEGKIKEFLDKHLPPAPQAEPEPEPEPQASLSPEAALEKRQADVRDNPTDETARFELVKALLLHGDVAGARSAFAPVAAQTTAVRRFGSLKHWLEAIDYAATNPANTATFSELDAKIAANKRDFDARFAKARHAIAQQRWTDALDELLEILMRDKAWQTDLARKTAVAVLDIMQTPPPKVADGQIPPDDPVVATYRRRLSSVILS